MKIALTKNNSLISRVSNDISFTNPTAAPFALRIKSLVAAYHTDYDFLRFFVATDDAQAANPFAIICIYDSIATVAATNIVNRDIVNRDIGEFILLNGDVQTILTDNTTADGIISCFGENFFKKSGDILAFSHKQIGNNLINQNSSSPFTIQIVSPHEYYKFIKENWDEKVFNEELFSSWYCDISHKIRHNTAQLYELKYGNTIACVGGILFRANNEQYLGGICTKKDLRNRGYCKNLVSSLIRGDFSVQAEKNVSIDQTIITHLFTENFSLSKLYLNLGFRKIGKWAQLSKNRYSI